ncbi:MAG: TonB-dependent receptor plug domain-containing protein, partial [Betaproteobacteria bacterium]|nr:TonB-dependent receptor plug domain-containing protein [Betaproteobacteria bacterium]
MSPTSPWASCPGAWRYADGGVRRLSALAARPVHAAPRALARCARPGVRAALAASPLLWACGAALAQQAGDAAAVAIDRVVVVGTTPLPGPGVDLRDVPANVQRYTARDLDSRGPRPIGDFLERVPTGVVTQSAQGNPYQPDVSFRGFAGSPVLGTPQGISVFQDGVRINEPFGDAVNWDLIPRAAIAEIQFVPGTQPVYGLNTLGGAI